MFSPIYRKAWPVREKSRFQRWPSIRYRRYLLLQTDETDLSEEGLETKD